MLILSRKVDYALIALTDLAGNGGLLPLSQIASDNHLSKKFLDRVMGQLKKALLVSSCEGKLGGYKLSKLANKITVLDVVKAVEGELIVPYCHKKEKCFAAGCRHGVVWQVARRNLEDTFSSFKISDLTKNMRRKSLTFVEDPSQKTKQSKQLYEI